MKILFGIMSAVQAPETVASLVDALGPRHRVLIHHDWSQKPDFSLARPNVLYVNDPARTGWADWGFSQGILRLIEEGLERTEFDYFQLLSPTCMPIKPVKAFEDHLDSVGADFLTDSIRLDSDPNVFMSHAWRAYAPAATFAHRILRRSRRWYFGRDEVTPNRAGLAFPSSSMADKGGIAGLRARVAFGITSFAKRGIGVDHPFGADFPCYAGSTWFTASHKGCRYVIAKSKDRAFMEVFSRLYMGDEMLFPSLFMNSGMKCAPSPHLISQFEQARPAWLQSEDLDRLLSSPSFFARKFPEDPASEVRLALIERLRQRVAGSETNVPPANSSLMTSPLSL